MHQEANKKANEYLGLSDERGVGGVDDAPADVAVDGAVDLAVLHLAEEVHVDVRGADVPEVALGVVLEDRNIIQIGPLLLLTF